MGHNIISYGHRRISSSETQNRGLLWWQTWTPSSLDTRHPHVHQKAHDGGHAEFLKHGCCCANSHWMQWRQVRGNFKLPAQDDGLCLAHENMYNVTLLCATVMAMESAHVVLLQRFQNSPTHTLNDRQEKQQETAIVRGLSVWVTIRKTQTSTNK